MLSQKRKWIRKDLENLLLVLLRNSEKCPETCEDTVLQQGCAVLARPLSCCRHDDLHQLCGTHHSYQGFNKEHSLLPASFFHRGKGNKISPASNHNTRHTHNLVLKKKQQQKPFRSWWILIFTLCAITIHHKIHNWLCTKDCLYVTNFPIFNYQE